MSKKMLIDATHPEETRVVVLENGRVDELDVDTSTKKQIKGNIYLAKVVRVEPSLQAAFVDYGGNRHGFLAFGEIHPDYYQIPVADREALKEMIMTSHEDEADTEETSGEVETVSDNEPDEATHRRPAFFKKYKIQEVIRQGQVMLIQVVKEERGNKGAALTTYLSLAGRFSVLMPNNGKGGGVSRKITNAKDRKSLRTIVDKLPIPQGMSVIIRTAGQGKTKTEIKRDYDYLIKTWMKIREDTLESLAPKLIHEEGDIIKRSLRDVFTPDIDEIWVEGESVFKSTKEFMKMLMPAQAKKIKQYKDVVSLFQAHQVETQLESIHSNIVQLRSGGYLVIDQTEALVAVDVNSGRATRDHDIEETALRINLETCDELARQLRLRDMAGLIVIDFIDMDEAKNNAAVERRLKEALKKDRARIQVGKMSGFGLMEMSRQRLRSSFLESSYKPCPHCGGKGVIRSVESCAMHAMHILEDAGAKNAGNTLLLSLPSAVASYVLNNKRANLIALEDYFHLSIRILPDDTLIKSSDFKLERLRTDGERAVLQTEHQVQVPNNIQNNSRNKADKDKSKNEKNKQQNKTQNTNPAKEKPADTVVEQSDVVVESAAPQSEEHAMDTGGDRKNKRNKRRREWRKKKREKRLAEAAALADDVTAPAAEQAPETKSETPTETTPVSEKPAKQPRLIGEEKFKVVEQEPIVLFNSHAKKETPAETPAEQKPVETPVEKAPRSNKKPGRQPKNTSKPAPAKTPTATPAEKPVATPAVANDVPASEPIAANNVSDEPQKKRGGWWNKLVN